MKEEHVKLSELREYIKTALPRCLIPLGKYKKSLRDSILNILKDKMITDDENSLLKFNDKFIDEYNSEGGLILRYIPSTKGWNFSAYNHYINAYPERYRDYILLNIVDDLLSSKLDRLIDITKKFNNEYRRLPK